MKTIARGRDAMGRSVELRDCGETGYKHTPLGQIPSDADERYRYVIFRAGNCDYVSNGYDAAYDYLRAVTVNDRWYDMSGYFEMVTD